MAGQSGNPGESGLRSRSHRPRPWPFPPPSVRWSVAVRGRFRRGRWTARTTEPGTHGPRAGCKTVGSAYVGSNPTPATTSENGPLAAETRPGGPFSSCHAMYQGASLWVDAWQCARTYGVQRPGKTSGAYNRSLCRSAPVLSHYPGAGTARLTMCRTSRPTGSVLRRPARARRRAGLVRVRGWGGLPYRPAPSDRGSY